MKNKIYLLDRNYFPDYVEITDNHLYPKSSNVYRSYALPTFAEISKAMIGAIPDAISCTVTEELNGIFELEMEYPIDGTNAEYINFFYIIATKSCPKYTGILPSDTDPLIQAINNYQLFRIYDISYSLSNTMVIKAEQVSYDACGALVKPRTGSNINSIAYSNSDMISDILADINSKTIAPYTYKKPSEFTYKLLSFDDRAGRYGVSNPFVNANRKVFPVYDYLTRKVNNVDTQDFKRPYYSLKSVILGDENSLKYAYGSNMEVYYSGFNIYITIGSCRDTNFEVAKVRYGLNMTEFEQEFDTTGMYRYLYPHDPLFVNDPDYSGGTHDFDIIDLLDTTVTGRADKIDPQVKELFEGYTMARKCDVDAYEIWKEYNPNNKIIKNSTEYDANDLAHLSQSDRNGVFKPAITKAYEGGYFDSLCTLNHTINLSFESLKSYGEYSDLTHLQDVYIGTKVLVEYPKLGISLTEKCVKTVYDVLQDRYTEVTLSTLPKTLSTN